MSMLNKRVLPALNGKQEAILLKWKPENDHKGERTRLTVQLKDREQDLIIFPSSEDYFLGCLRTQFNLQEAIDAVDLLDSMVKDKTPFTIWFYYDEQYGFQFRFHEVRETVSEEAEAI